MLKKRKLHFTPVDLNSLNDRDKRNVAIARSISDEPDVLEWDLTKAGVIEGMHYHDDLFWITDALEQIKTQLTGLTIEISCSKVTVCARYGGKRHVYHVPGSTSIIPPLWMALSDFSLWNLQQEKQHG